ncbi:MAG: cell division protein ZapE [Gammaproteobacteria bacterium]|nr:cell division protein ZapE [Gammaproteobacteria bacterium]
MTPMERYQQDLRRKNYHKDARQLIAVSHTQDLYDAILRQQNHKNSLTHLFRKPPPVRGLYLWGGTGRGKTYLVDSFYQCLPTDKKHRIHFHRFMRDIHSRLKRLPKSPNPLVIIAKDLATKIQILCVDEFHVHDIADAMIMAGLLKALFDKEVTLVATSNIAIEDLYKNGLQRDRFMYAIGLLKKHTLEVDLGTGTDYRYHVLEENGTYFAGNADSSKKFLERQLGALVPCTPKRNHQLEINHRQIDYVALADDVVWFNFDALCDSPRSASDYIEIARMYHTVILSDVPILKPSQDAAAKRFIHLIDALYDNNVKLIISAQTEPTQLYQGSSLEFAFQRTASRLMEMRSKTYLSAPHRTTID